MNLPDWRVPQDKMKLDRASVIASYKADPDKRAKHIYILIDPRDGSIRYVGKSIRPKERLTNHMNEPPTNCHRSHWLEKLKSEGLRPIQQIVETIDDDWPWQQSEQYWIKLCRDNGCNLVNNTDGGDGVLGLPLDTRNKMRQTWLGRKHKPETLAKIGESSSKRRWTESRRELMRSKMSGRAITWGENLSKSKVAFTYEECLAIRTELGWGGAPKELAKSWGTNAGIITKIKYGEYPTGYPYKFNDEWQPVFDLDREHKLGEDECMVIRALHRNGDIIAKIADAFQSNKSTIASVIHGRYPASNPYPFLNIDRIADGFLRDGVDVAFLGIGYKEVG